MKVLVRVGYPWESIDVSYPLEQDARNILLGDCESLETQTRSIADCEICADIAERGFESKSPGELSQVAQDFLSHVVESHPGEVIAVLAERYLPIFAAKRELR